MYRRFLLHIIIIFFFIKSINGQQHYNVIGDAIFNGSDCYSITPSSDYKEGAIWYKDSIDLQNTFDLYYKVNFGCDNLGGDGLAFVIHSSGDSVAPSEGFIGYDSSSIKNSIAVEFDTYQDVAFGDSLGDHIALMKNGITDHNDLINTLVIPKLINSGTDIEDCSLHEVHIMWFADSTKLKVYFDCELLIDYTGNIINTVFNGNSIVNIGWTSSTRADFNEHKVCAKFNSYTDKLEDTLLCVGDTIQFDAGYGTSFQWQPFGFTSDSSIINPLFFPDYTETFHLRVIDSCQVPRYDTVLVDVRDDTLLIDTDLIFCDNTTYQISVDTGYMSYLWNNGVTTNSFQSDIDTLYRLEVSDGLCIFTDSIHAKKLAILKEPDVLDHCLNDTVLLYVDSLRYSGSSFIWSTGSTDSTVRVIMDNSKTISVQLDACTDSIDLFISDLGLNFDTISGFCSGDTAVIDAGSNFKSYLWSTGDTTQSISILNSQNVYVTVRDSSGCATKDSTRVIVGGSFSSNYNVTPETCPYSNNGQVIAGFTTFFPIDSIRWSNGLSGSTISNLEAGTYQVSVYDSIGCGHKDVAIVGLQSNMILTGSGDSLLCFGDSLGNVSVQVSNGFGSYSYNWSNGAINNTLTGLNGGNYSITITDDIFCTISNTYQVWEPTLLTLNTLDTSFSCANNSGGNANTIASGGTTPYSYIWSNGDTTSSMSSLVIGDYYVTVSDSNNCKIIDSTIVTVSKPFTVSLTSDTSFLCYGDSTQMSVNLIDSGNPGVPVSHIYRWLPITGIDDTNNLTVIAKPLISQEYVIEVTDGILCKAYDTVFIKVNPPLTVSVSPDDTICTGVSIQLLTEIIDSGTLGVPAPYAFNWSPAKGLNHDNIEMPIASPDSSTEYNLTITDSNLCTANASLLINVSPYINVLLTGDSFLCYGDSTTLNAAVDAGAGVYVYEWSPSLYLNDTNSLNPVCTPTDTIEYIISAIDTNACVARDTFSIKVNPPLNIIANSYPTASCNYDPVTLSVSFDSSDIGTPGYSYLWQVINDTLNQDSLTHFDSSTTVAFLHDTAHFSVSVQDTQMCFAFDTLMIYINPLLKINLSSDTDFVCYGDSIFLNSSLIDSGTLGIPVPHLYEWFPVEFISDSLSFTPFAIPDSSMNFIIKVTDGNLCTSTDTVSIHVNPKLAVDAGVGDTVCIGSTINLQASVLASGTPGSPAPHAYQWYPLHNLTNPNLFYTDVTPDTSIVYKISITDLNQCIASDTVRIEIIDLKANINDDSTICQGNNIQLSGAVNGNAKWSDQLMNGSFFPDSNSLYPIYIPNPDSLGTIILSLSVTDSLGLCGNRSDTLYLTLDTMPELNIDLTQLNYCSLDTIDLMANVLNSDSLNWSVINSGGGIFISDTNTIQSKYLIDTIINNTVFCFSLEGINNNTCPSIYDTICINAMQSPFGIIDSIGRACKGDSLLISSSFIGNSSVIWSDSNLGGGFNTYNDTTLYSNDSLSGLIKLFFELNSNSSCIAFSDSLEVQIDSLPIIEVINLQENECYQDSVLLEANGALIYYWYLFDTILIDSIADSVNQIILNFSDTSYINVVGIDENYCIGSVIDTINKKEIPKPQAYTVYDITSCYPLNVLFDYNVNLPNKMNIVEEHWIIENEIDFNESPVSHVFNKDLNISYPYTYSSILNIKYDNLCESSDTIEVNICEDIMIPNIITPNGDGKNDVFKIPGYFERMSPCSFVIYDRWGNIVYDNNQYQNDWDGTTANGKVLNVDTYFYRLKCDKGQWSGWLKLLY